MTALLVILSVAGLLAADLLLDARRKRQAAAAALFHRGHTWALPTARGLARVGIDDFARHLLGNIDRVELPEVGREVREGDPLFAAVRGSRKVEFVSPMGGKVVSVRHDAARAHVPGDDPYRKGYFLTLAPADMAQSAAHLRGADEAPGWIDRELVRLYEFLGARAAQPLAVGPTMRDGGAFAPGIVDKVDEGVLPELVRNFLR
jgi:glycine cleavage system H protein